MTLLSNIVKVLAIVAIASWISVAGVPMSPDDGTDSIASTMFDGDSVLHRSIVRNSASSQNRQLSTHSDIVNIAKRQQDDGDVLDSVPTDDGSPSSAASSATGGVLIGATAVIGLVTGVMLFEFLQVCLLRHRYERLGAIGGGKYQQQQRSPLPAMVASAVASRH